MPEDLQNHIISEAKNHPGQVKFISGNLWDLYWPRFCVLSCILCKCGFIILWQEVDVLKTVWISCMGENVGDQENLPSGNIKYNPARGIPGYFFPYRNQPNYKTPFVMVQLIVPVSSRKKHSDIYDITLLMYFVEIWYPLLMCYWRHMLQVIHSSTLSAELGLGTFITTDRTDSAQSILRS